VREPAGDRQPDETAVVVDDRRTSAVGMGLESHRRLQDLERREPDLQIDLHVVNCQRLVVVGDVEVRRFLVADRAADQEAAGGHAEGAHAVLAIVQHIEVTDVVDAVVPGVVVRQDRSGVEGRVGGGHGTQE
jgi:hypothetical protein